MQTSPAIRVFWFILLVAAFVVAAWFSYDYGRTHAQPQRHTAVAQDGEAGQRIEELEQERDALRKKVAKLEQDIRDGHQALDAARARAEALEAAQNARAQAPRAGEQPVEPPQQNGQPTEPPQAEGRTSLPAQDDRRLALANLRIDATESDRRFHYRFSIVGPADNGKAIVGTIWIAVNGLSRGEPTRLSLKEVSSERRPFVKMNLKGQQDVEGEVTLPEGFNPRNIMIEAKPYDERYQGASEKFDWVAGS